MRLVMVSLSACSKLMQVPGTDGQKLAGSGQLQLKGVVSSKPPLQLGLKHSIRHLVVSGHHHPVDLVFSKLILPLGVIPKFKHRTQSRLVHNMHALGLVALTWFSISSLQLMVATMMALSLLMYCSTRPFTSSMLPSLLTSV